MERILERTLLYDFYGDLLTENKRKVYEAVVLNDIGYSELAASEGISRQGVHDLVRRCDRQLDEYESKLQLLHRFLKIREHASRISALSGKEKDSDRLTEIHRLAEAILEEL